MSHRAIKIVPSAVNFVRFVRFSHQSSTLKTLIIQRKSVKMNSILSFFGWNKSYSSSSGKSKEELEKKVAENAKKLSNEEWKDLLDQEAFHVAREKGTEAPFSSCLNKEKRPGTFTCVCCQRPLFKSSKKFESGTGWPSFWDTIKTDDGSESVRFETDKSLFMKRVEVLCQNCDAHLGHVFEDGPQPTGKRYCMNGSSLSFKSE